MSPKHSFFLFQTHYPHIPIFSPCMLCSSACVLIVSLNGYWKEWLHIQCNLTMGNPKLSALVYATILSLIPSKIYNHFLCFPHITLCMCVCVCVCVCVRVHVCINLGLWCTRNTILIILLYTIHFLGYRFSVLPLICCHSFWARGVCCISFLQIWYIFNITNYWAIQWSWFARVNALCNRSRKMSREVAAHFWADFWVGVASRCV